jgi:hypothetical protein
MSNKPYLIISGSIFLLVVIFHLPLPHYSCNMDNPACPIICRFSCCNRLLRLGLLALAEALSRTPSPDS